MKTKKIIKTMLFMIAFVFIEINIFAAETVASISKIDGSVQVERDARKIAGRKGLILHDKDVVVTGNNAKATIVFRDGTEIRLFQKTRFVIEQSKESKNGSRKFLNNFKLKIGSFWGKFTRARQTTKVTTPTATIGIKGTNLAMNADDVQLNVALSSGIISVANGEETIDLEPGKMIQGIKKDEKFSNKIVDLPYMIKIEPDQQKIEIPAQGKTNEIKMTIQLVDIKSNKDYHLVGDVYLSIDNDKIEFPNRITLNSRGYARFNAIIKPFTTSDYQNGQVEILAIMDGEEYFNIGSGQTLLTYDIPDSVDKTIRIDVNSGERKQ